MKALQIASQSVSLTPARRMVECQELATVLAAACDQSARATACHPFLVISGEGDRS
ncbi:hypothetical protein SAMCFNEI73_pB0318 (plasmid) [Sinorhizobium americanum]|uniref:Uncharacterized protein n=1 Tax=Sinorhizobium americanum TaxID=194963 RepID=A0A1L3LTV1_9HYPH|nr:hypothetical protein SAMCFNEI73_pB0318 [Sinorhizobium americanum]